MQIAVTGGLGRLGRYVVRELAQHAVRVLDIGAAAECHPADLRDIDALRAGLRDIEVVVHLGGIDRSFITDDALTMQVNAMGTWNLFEASLQVGVRRVIHCSSSSVLGLDIQQSAHGALLSADRRGASGTRDRRLRAQQDVRRADRGGVLAARAGGDRHPPMPRGVSRDDGLHGRQARARRGATSRRRTCAPMSGRRTAPAASPPRRRPTTAVSRHSSWPPTMRSRPNRPSAGWKRCTATTIPLHDAALYQRTPRASPVSHAMAHRRLGWTPTTRWTPGSIAG